MFTNVSEECLAKTGHNPKSFQLRDWTARPKIKWDAYQNKHLLMYSVFHKELYNGIPNVTV
jgi:hypothetical protein